MSLKKNDTPFGSEQGDVSARRLALIAAKEQVLQESMARMRQIILEYGSLEPFLGPEISVEPKAKLKG